MWRLWTNLSPHRRGEIVGVGIITIALIIFLSLVSYDVQDFVRTGRAKTANWIGMPGAYLGWAVFTLIGWNAFLVPLFLLYWGLRRFRSKQFSNSLLPLSGTLIFILSLCTLLAMFQHGDKARMFSAGGLIGSYAAARMIIFGPVGSYLILFALVAISLLLSTEVLFTPMLTRSRDALSQRWVRWRTKRRTIKTNLETTSDRKKTQPKEEGEAEEEEVILVGPTDGPDEQEDLFPRILTGAESRRKRKAKKGRHPAAPRRLENYKLPPLSLLTKPEGTPEALSRQEILRNSETLERTLSEFGIAARVVEVNYGPVITRYELEPPPGVKVNRIVGLADNLALALRASHVRIVAPIPGKAAVGVEIPNRKRSDVLIREILSSDSYQAPSSLLKLAVGKTISGEPFVADLASMPHLLIAGATGSGKSVCAGSIIASLLINASPEEVKFLMIDPKRVELKLYNDLPHLIAPVVTDARRAAAALRWVVEEMEERYHHLSRAGVRDIDEFNHKQRIALSADLDEADPVLPSRMPYIIVIIDELADLMMVARGEIEAAVARLAQMARAVGIHLVLATQRPSVNIITGVIKANFPTRIAFQVSSKVDSRTILDCNGAESLLGRGDMLFSYGGAAKPVRLQGSLVTTTEIEALTEFIKAQQKVDYLEEDFEEQEEAGGLNDDGLAGDDDLYEEAVELVYASGSASTSLLQRRLKIGYGRAARLLDEMEEQGIVGPPRGSKPREVLAGR